MKTLLDSKIKYSEFLNPDLLQAKKDIINLQSNLIYLNRNFNENTSRLDSTFRSSVAQYELLTNNLSSDYNSFKVEVNGVLDTLRDEFTAHKTAINSSVNGISSRLTSLDNDLSNRMTTLETLVGNKITEFTTLENQLSNNWNEERRTIIEEFERRIADVSGGGGSGGSGSLIIYWNNTGSIGTSAYWNAT